MASVVKPEIHESRVARLAQKAQCISSQREIWFAPAPVSEAAAAIPIIQQAIVTGVQITLFISLILIIPSAIEVALA